MHHIYPAVFEKEDPYYIVSFPDLPGCMTYGISEQTALLMAEDASAGWLDVTENDCHETVPEPSSISSIPVPENGFVSLVHAAYHMPEEIGLIPYNPDEEDEDEDFELPDGYAKAILSFCENGASDDEQTRQA